jgi:hypothetical protein
MNRRLKQLPLIVAISPFLVNLAFATSGQPNLNNTEPVQFETRCGWLSNPTPANIWLNDRDGEWTIAVQGGYQLEKDWAWPKFKKGQWIVTNTGNHGYGCVCLQMRVNKETKHVLEIKSARPRPLAGCRKEPSLRKMESTFK